MDTELTLLQDIKSALWILIVIVGIGVVVNYGRAVAASYKIIKSDLKDYFYNTATKMYENEKYNELIKYCHERLKKKPKKAYGFWFLGKAHFNRKEFDEAEKYVQKAIEIHPSWEEEWVSPYLKNLKPRKLPLTKRSNLPLNTHSPCYRKPSSCSRAG